MLLKIDRQFSVLFYHCFTVSMLEYNAGGLDRVKLPQCRYNLIRDDRYLGCDNLILAGARSDDLIYICPLFVLSIHTTCYRVEREQVSNDFTDLWDSKVRVEKYQALLG